MRKTLENRITELEGQAGIGSNLPDLVLIAGFGVINEEFHHAGINLDGKEVEIEREPNEGAEAFKQRAIDLARANRREAAPNIQVVWMRP